MARLALQVLWHDLRAGTPEYEGAWEALRQVHDMLVAREHKELAETGLPGHYLIIRPVSPLAIPGPEDAARIREAITTLFSLGMICGPDDDD
jgi:hypothetical protein